MILNRTKFLLRTILQLSQLRQIPFSIVSYGSYTDSGKEFFFVELESGQKFVGWKSSRPYKYYRFFPKAIKRKIPATHGHLVMDILKRYWPPLAKKDPRYFGKYYGLSKGEVVMELGAFIGYYAMKAAELVGPTGKVLAVEAVPENYEILQEMKKVNNLPQLIPVHAAIWNTTGKLSFNISTAQKNSAKEGVIASSKVIEVPSITIDDLTQEHKLSRLDFARIQLNGAEHEALLGMPEVIKKFRPKLLVATLHSKEEEIKQTLENHKYDFRKIHRNYFAG